jgi:hypothetical protein
LAYNAEALVAKDRNPKAFPTQGNWQWIALVLITLLYSTRSLSCRMRQLLGRSPRLGCEVRVAKVRSLGVCMLRAETGNFGPRWELPCLEQVPRLKSRTECF